VANPEMFVSAHRGAGFKKRINLVNNRQYPSTTVDSRKTTPDADCIFVERNARPQIMNQSSTEQQTKIKQRPYLMGKDLCELYGVSRYRLRKMLKEVEAEMGKRNGYYLKNWQVMVFVNHFGRPPGQTLNARLE